jgi:multidrug efflux pump subunit AcrA (membrane-fusion protein)
VSKNALVVPTGIIQEDANNNKFVYKVEESNGKTGKAKKVVVKIGKSSDNVTEILSGLSVNDVIVTDGVNSISEGMKLNF